MRQLLAAFLSLTACRAASVVSPSAVPNATAPSDWQRDGGLRQDDADARCRAELPACPHAFAVYQVPPSPCAHQGTACTEVRSTHDGQWGCGCDACVSSDDCKPGEHCRTTAPRCSHERAPLRCMAGPPPLPEPCRELAPPIPVP